MMATIEGGEERERERREREERERASLSKKASATHKTEKWPGSYAYASSRQEA